MCAHIYIYIYIYIYNLLSPLKSGLIDGPMKIWESSSLSFVFVCWTVKNIHFLALFFELLRHSFYVFFFLTVKMDSLALFFCTVKPLFSLLTMAIVLIFTSSKTFTDFVLHIHWRMYAYHILFIGTLLCIFVNTSCMYILYVSNVYISVNEFLSAYSGLVYHELMLILGIGEWELNKIPCLTP